MAARDPESGVLLARDRSKPTAKRRGPAVLTKEGSAMIAARVPNQLLAEIEMDAARDLLSTSDYLRLAVLEKLRRRRKQQEKK